MGNRYVAFLLRLWQVGAGESAVWRASLENPHTGERSAFASLEALMAHLETLTQREPEPEPQVPARPTAQSGQPGR